MAEVNEQQNRNKFRAIGVGQLGTLLDGHSEEQPISAQSYLRGCYRAGLG